MWLNEGIKLFYIIIIIYYFNINLSSNNYFMAFEVIVAIGRQLHNYATMKSKLTSSLWTKWTVIQFQSWFPGYFVKEHFVNNEKDCSVFSKHCPN